MATKTSSWLLPLAIGAGVTLLLVSAGGRTAPPPPIYPPPPRPQPGPDLLQQFNTILTQATTNPQSVNPDQMDALAAQLDANGYTQQGATLRALAAQIRLTQNRPIPLPPAAGPNNALLQRYQTLLVRVRDPQSTIVVDELDNTSRELSNLGFTTESQILALEAQKARQERDPLACIVPPCPFGPVKRPQARIRVPAI